MRIVALYQFCLDILYRLMPFNFYTRYVSLWVMGLFIAMLVSPFDVMLFLFSFVVCLYFFLFNLFCRLRFRNHLFFFGAKKVLDERVYHIAYVPSTPEPYYHFTGQEIQPRPVGEENGAVVFYYNPISAVNYVSVVFDDFFLCSSILPFRLISIAICSFATL